MEHFDKNLEHFELLEKEFEAESRKIGYEEVFFRRSVGSTNDEAKKMFERISSERGAVVKSDGELPSSAVFWALEQTAGRGRLGRRWNSAVGKGITMSFVVPVIGNAGAVTIAAGASMCLALRIAGYHALLKWPNDVLIDGGKVCGILSERIGNGEGGYIVVGAGLNLSQPFFGALAETAISLSDASTSEDISSEAASHPISKGGIGENLFAFGDDFMSRNLPLGESRTEDLLFGMRLMVNGIGRAVRNFDKINRCEFIDIAKRYSATVGREVEVHNIHDKAGYSAIARDIDVDGALVIETENGQRKRVFAGEVTLKKNRREGASNI